jgi:hypothetical protein
MKTPNQTLIDFFISNFNMVEDEAVVFARLLIEELFTHGFAIKVGRNTMEEDGI